MQNCRGEGCVQEGGTSEKKQEVKEDKNLTVVWAHDSEGITAPLGG